MTIFDRPLPRVFHQNKILELDFSPYLTTGPNIIKNSQNKNPGILTSISFTAYGAVLHSKCKELSVATSI